MALTKYDKSITTDFGGNFNSDRFTLDIAASAIKENLNCINTDDDAVELWFENALDGTDEALLATKCSEHSAEPVLELVGCFLPISDVTTKNSSWKRLQIFPFDGTDAMDIKKLKLYAGNNKPNKGNCSARLFDRTNGALVCSWDTIDQLEITEYEKDIGSFTLPASPAILELQVKANNANNGIVVNGLKFLHTD